MILSAILRRLPVAMTMLVLASSCALTTKQPVLSETPAPVTPKTDYVRLGDARLQEGRLVEALSIFREGLREEPNSVELHERMAYILDQLGRTDEAMDMYGDALRIAPDNEHVHLGLAHLLYKRENYEQATVHFKQAARVNPLNASAYRWAAMCLIKIDRWEDAQTEIEAEAKIRPGDPETKRTLESIRQSVAHKRALEGRKNPPVVPKIPVVPPPSSGNAGVLVSPSIQMPLSVQSAPPAKAPEGPPQISVFEIPDPPKSPSATLD